MELIAALLMAILLAVVAANFGYNRGVEHTEQRWNDAVVRGEWHRNNQS
jgi:hypothetical protein